MRQDVLQQEEHIQFTDPGEPEHRTARRRENEGIPVDDNAWADILKTTKEIWVTINYCTAKRYFWSKYG